jgi:hypothetical protein
MARAQTWTIIGAPAISSSGFRGKRVAFSLAGMIVTCFEMMLGMGGCDN